MMRPPSTFAARAAAALALFGVVGTHALPVQLSVAPGDPWATAATAPVQPAPATVTGAGFALGLSNVGLEYVSVQHIAVARRHRLQRYLSSGTPTTTLIHRRRCRFN